jgi:hypothetical protein
LNKIGITRQNTSKIMEKEMKNIYSLLIALLISGNSFGLEVKTIDPSFELDSESIKGLLSEKEHIQNSPTCISVRELQVEGAAFTEKLFLGTTGGDSCAEKQNKDTYFIKGITKNGEVSSLLVVDNFFKSDPQNIIDVNLPDIIYGVPDSNAKIDTFISQFKSWGLIDKKSVASYQDINQKFFSIAKGAKGLQLSSIYRSDDNDLKEKAFSAYGTALAKFHQHYMDAHTIPNPDEDNQPLSIFKTITHGDAHWGNVFYDPQNDKITFIDNDTFSLSMVDPDDKNSAIEDVNFASFMTASLAKECLKTEGYDSNVCLTIFDNSKYFLKAYLAEYPEPQQIALKIALKRYANENAISTLESKMSGTSEGLNIKERTQIMIQNFNNLIDSL